MGYYASGYGTITIRTDYDTPTLQKLYNSKTLDRSARIMIHRHCRNYITAKRWTSATVQKNFKRKLFLI